MFPVAPMDSHGKTSIWGRRLRICGALSGCGVIVETMKTLPIAHESDAAEIYMVSTMLWGSQYTTLAELPAKEQTEIDKKITFCTHCKQVKTTTHSSVMSLPLCIGKMIIVQIWKYQCTYKCSRTLAVDLFGNQRWPETNRLTSEW